MRTPMWLPAATLVVAALAGVGPVAAQQQNREQLRAGQLGGNPVFGADVSMVMVNVSVLDEAGLPVAGLAAEDFVLLEDGITQTINVVLSPSEVPVDVGVLIDISASVRTDQLAVKRDAVAFLEALGPRDCVHVLAFGNQIDTGAWGRPDDPALRAAIDEAPIGGGTPLYDAMIVAIGRLTRAVDMCAPAVEPAGSGEGAPGGAPASVVSIPNEERRKALVVITDGGDTTSSAAFAAAVNVAWRAAVPVFPVAVGHALTEGRRGNMGTAERFRASTDADARVRSRNNPSGEPIEERTDPFDHANRVGAQSAQQRWDARMNSYGSGLAASLREIADISGGKYVDGGQSAAGQEVAYNELLTWLRASYVLGYVPPPPRPVARRGQAVWHELEVRATDRNLRLYARPGYFRSDVDPVASKAAVEAGVEMLRSGLTGNALTAFARALDRDPFNWQAYYYRGRALGVLERIEDAYGDFLAAARLGPGIGPAHEFASIAAGDVGDFDAAWDHAIRAYHAGVDVRQRFDELRLVAGEPPDLAFRLTAPRIYVGDAVIPDPEAQGLLEAVLRRLRLAVSDSDEIALTPDPQDADFFLRLQVDAVDTSGSGRLRGTLELREPGGRGVDEEEISIGTAYDEEELLDALSARLAAISRRLVWNREAREQRVS